MMAKYTAKVEASKKLLTKFSKKKKSNLQIKSYYKNIIAIKIVRETGIHSK